MFLSLVPLVYYWCSQVVLLPHKATARCRAHALPGPIETSCCCCCCCCWEEEKEDGSHSCHQSTRVHPLCRLAFPASAQCRVKCLVYGCAPRCKEGEGDAASGDFPRPLLRVLTGLSAARKQLAQEAFNCARGNESHSTHGKRNSTASPRRGLQGERRRSAARPEAEMH